MLSKCSHLRRVFIYFVGKDFLFQIICYQYMNENDLYVVKKIFI